MATRYHIAAKELRGTLSAYAKRFGYLEVALGAAKAPTLTTLRRWRREVPPSFEFGVVAPPALCTPRPGAALDEALAHTIEAINALGARMVLLKTPLEVTPSQLWRDRMQKLLDRLPRDVTSVAWEPGGLWEDEDIAPQAKRWGVVPVIDVAQRPDLPKGPIAYVRLRALGETRSFGPTIMEQVVQAVGDRRDAYVVLEVAKALDEAKILRKLAARGPGLSAEANARVLRPRSAGPKVSAIRVADDEQE